MGSMSPSSTIHLGKSVDMLARSRMMQENSPARGEGGRGAQHNLYMRQGSSSALHHALVTIIWLSRTCISAVGSYNLGFFSLRGAQPLKRLTF